MLGGPFNPWPCLKKNDAVSNVLSSNKVNIGQEEGRLFETEFASYVGTEYSIALPTERLH